MPTTPKNITARPGERLDVLSEVLRDLRLESTVFSVFELRSPWGLAKNPLEGAPFHAVVEGRCFLGLEDGAPIALSAGDLVVLPKGNRHTLLSSPNARPTPFKRVLVERGVRAAWHPGMRLGPPMQISFGGRGQITRIISGIFSFRDPRRNPLIDALPPLLHVKGLHGRGPPWLERAVGTLIEEATSGQPGSQTIAERAADIMFVQALRAHLATEVARTSGWLRGLADPSVGKAIAEAHSRPGYAWTVASLARVAGASRSLFAARFRELVGVAVMDYVTALRMHTAAGLLDASASRLSDIASAVGYGSEISFSRAFRRWSGQSPGAYRRQVRDSGAVATL